MRRNGEEFHPATGDEIILRVTAPGVDLTRFTSIDHVLQTAYEPDLSSTAPNNFNFTLDRAGCNSDEFKIKIKRHIADYYGPNAKISYGFKLFTNHEVVINDSKDGVRYKMPDDTSEVFYQNLVVVRFCIGTACPDARP